MALQFQSVPVVFNEGLDTKTNPQLTAKLSLLLNATLEGQGTIKKRTGYSALASSVLGGGSLGAGKALALYNDELSVMAGERLYAVAANSLIDRGLCSTLAVRREDLVGVTTEPQFDWDEYRDSTLSISAFTEGPNVTLVVTSVAEGVQYQRTQLNTAASTAYFPRVIANVGVVYLEGTALKYRTFDSANPHQIGAAITVVAAGVQVAPLDAIPIQGNTRVMAAYVSGLNQISLITFNAVTGAIVNGPTTIVAIGGNPEITCFEFGSGRLAIFWWDSVGVWVRTYSSTLTGPSITQLLATAAAEGRIAVAGLTSTSAAVYYATTTTMGGSTSSRVWRNSITDFGTAGGALGSIAHVRVHSRGFAIGGVPHLLVSFRGDTTAGQTGLYLLEDTSGSFRVKARALYGDAFISGVTTDCVSLTVSVNGTSYSVLAVQRQFDANAYRYVRLVFSDFPQKRCLPLNGSLHLPGGKPSGYDGRTVCEESFNVYPYYMQVNLVAGALTGAYQWTYVFEWTNAAGKIERSAPAAPVSATLAAERANLVLQTLTLTDKRSTAAPVKLVVYRTGASGTIFYRAGSVSNDATTETVAFSDTITDANLISQEVLYTTGGVLDNVPLSAHQVATVHQGRRFAVPSERPTRVEYTNIPPIGDAEAHNEAYAFDADLGLGEVVQLASMDEKLILLHERGISYIAGEGPDRLGLQNGYTSPQKISSDIGCRDPYSLVEIPQGLIFKSGHGFYLLDHGLGLSYVGAPVEEDNAATVLSAVLLREKRQVRFICSSLRCWVYDFEHIGEDGVGQWSEFDNYVAVDAIEKDGDFIHLKSSGVTYLDNSGYADAGASYVWYAQTSWIKLAGLTGFQRVRWVRLLGQYHSDTTINLTVAVDYDDSVNVESAVKATAGSYSAGNPFQVRHRMARQKCEAIRFYISESSPGTLAAGVALTAMELEIGVKRGGFKLPTGKTV